MPWFLILQMSLNTVCFYIVYKYFFSSKWMWFCDYCTTPPSKILILCTFSVRCCTTGGVVWSFETGTLVVAACFGAGDNPIHFCVTTKWLDLGHQFNHLPTCVHFSPPNLTFSPVKPFENNQMFAVFYPKNEYFMSDSILAINLITSNSPHVSTSVLEIAVKSGCTKIETRPFSGPRLLKSVCLFLLEILNFLMLS